jgi:general secretion pathway protein G
MIKPLRPRLDHGFTLLELIVVITIIGILGTFIVHQVGHLPDKARAEKIRHDLRAVAEALEVFYVTSGRYPESLDELKPGNTPKPPIIIDQVNDPWGRPYELEFTDDGFRVRCHGRDGEPGGSGPDEDHSYPPENDS